jgi:hypothetical protein
MLRKEITIYFIHPHFVEQTALVAVMEGNNYGGSSLGGSENEDKT